MFPENDTEYAEYKVIGVEKIGEDWGVTHSDNVASYSLYIPGNSPVVPQVGMSLRLYGKGLGHYVRGIFLDGVQVTYISQEAYAEQREKVHLEYVEEEAAFLAELILPDPQTPGFEWTDDMREISGIHGRYERNCRRMVSQGCKWLVEHPEAQPLIRKFKGIEGIAIPDNDDGVQLKKAMMEGIKDATGLMQQACFAHILRGFGAECGKSWSAYQEILRKLKMEEKDEIR